MACSVETTRVSLEDCTCPICMCILIEPVTMPCHHELCRPCFKQNVEEASLLCPMCRTRIGTWARHATKTKTLVNTERWEQIQKLFPKRVRLRLEGKDEEDDNEDVTFHPPIHLAAPGEIRKEYEEELKKLRQQLLQERQKEEIESEALIRRLQEEEQRERENQNVQLEVINQNDELLARELDKVINEAGTDDPIDLLVEESKSRLTRSNSVASNKSSQSNSGTLDTFFNKYKAQTETRQTSPYPYPCLSPSEKEKGVDNSRSNSSVGKLSNSSAKAEICPINLVDHTYCPNPNAPKSSTIVRPPSSEIVAISDSSSDGVKERSESTKERSESTKERSESVGSNDSISNELCHFKPIQSCPRTPPRKMADGKIVDPPFVRTTPRNLSRNGFGSPVDSVTSPGLEPGSPIMQKRLTELALERQLLVQERSKSTSTGPDDGVHSTDTHRHNLHYLRDSSHSGDTLSRPPLHTVGESSISGLGSRTGGLLIPLEPLLEEHSHGEFDDFNSVLLSLGKPSVEHKDVHEPSTSRSPLQVKSPSLEKIKRSRHNSKDQKSHASNQRSIKDWFKKEDKSRANSADLFEDRSDVVGGETYKSEAGGEGTHVCEGDSDPEWGKSGLVRKKKRKHKVHESGDVEIRDVMTQKKDSKDYETVKRKKRHKSEKCGDILSDDNLSDIGDLDSGIKGTTALVRKKRKNGKRKKKVECDEEFVSDEEQGPSSRHRKFIQQVDSEIAFLSDSELSQSEPEDSSPVRKSNRKRIKGPKVEDFEFDLDALVTSESEESGVSHPALSRRERGRKHGKEDNGRLPSVSDQSDEDVGVKKKREKKGRKDISSVECDMSDNEIRKPKKSHKRGKKLWERGFVSDESDMDDSKLHEVSAGKTTVSSSRSKRGKGRSSKDEDVKDEAEVKRSSEDEGFRKNIKSTVSGTRRKRRKNVSDEDFDPDEAEIKASISEDEDNQKSKKSVSNVTHKQSRRQKNDEDFDPEEDEVQAYSSEDEDFLGPKTSIMSNQRQKRNQRRKNDKDFEPDENEVKASSSEDDNEKSKKSLASSLRQKRGKRRNKNEKELDWNEAGVRASSSDEEDPPKPKICTVSSPKHGRGKGKNVKGENLVATDIVSSEDENSHRGKKQVQHRKIKSKTLKNEDCDLVGTEVKASCSDEESLRLTKETVLSMRCRRDKGKRVKDAELVSAEAEVKESSSEDEASCKNKKCVKQRKKQVRKELVEPEVEAKSQRQRRKRKAVTMHKVSDSDRTDIEEEEREEKSLHKSPRRGRSRKPEKNNEADNIDEDDKSEAESSLKDVKQGRSKKASPKKQSPKKSSPKKTSPKKSPVKRAHCSESENSSPCKKRRTQMKEETQKALLGKRPHLRKCATEELLEENVDPNANRNNSSCMPSPSKGRRRRNMTENSDAKSECDDTDVTPRKRGRMEQADSDDDAFESPSKSKPQLSKKRSESVSVKALKPKTPVQRKGRRRHTTGDQQSIVRYLSGASDVDLRQDIDEEVESDATESFSQEDEDRKMALRLQRQFNLEQKFRIAAERFKGGAEQYQFRRKPRYLD